MDSDALLAAVYLHGHGPCCSLVSKVRLASTFTSIAHLEFLSGGFVSAQANLIKSHTISTEKDEMKHSLTFVYTE